MGPSALCALATSQSTPRSCTSMGRCGTAWHESDSTSAPTCGRATSVAGAGGPRWECSARHIHASAGTSTSGQRPCAGTGLAAPQTAALPWAQQNDHPTSCAMRATSFMSVMKPSILETCTSDTTLVRSHSRLRRCCSAAGQAGERPSWNCRVDQAHFAPA